MDGGAARERQPLPPCLEQCTAVLLLFQQLPVELPAVGRVPAGHAPRDVPTASLGIGRCAPLLRAVVPHRVRLLFDLERQEDQLSITALPCRGASGRLVPRLGLSRARRGGFRAHLRAVVRLVPLAEHRGHRSSDLGREALSAGLDAGGRDRRRPGRNRRDPGHRDVAP